MLNRRMPNGTYGGVRGGFNFPYSIPFLQGGSILRPVALYIFTKNKIAQSLYNPMVAEFLPENFYFMTHVS
jgi:hypothetical protein